MSAQVFTDAEFCYVSHCGFIEKVGSFGDCFSGQFYLVHLLMEVNKSDQRAV